MLTTLVFMAGLGMTPAQAGGLTLSNDPITYGHSGPPRPDTNQLPPPTVGVPGQSVWVHFALVGFSRDKAKMQPNLSVEMQATIGGKPTLAAPTVMNVNAGIDEKENGVPLRFLLPMNRVGDFNIE